MLTRYLKSPRLIAAVGLAVMAAVGISYAFGWPLLSKIVDPWLGREHSKRTVAAAQDPHAGHSHAPDAKHEHAHPHVSDPHEPGHSEETSLDLSPQARANLNLTADMLRPVALSNFRRTITIPAVVVPKPGRSQIVVSSPLNGIVTHVHAVTGEAVLPGDLMFEVRLTYEDLVVTQTEYLKLITELEVEDREVARLEQAAQSGAVSGKSLLERRYSKEKLEAALRAQREALKLHGLSDRQIDAIGSDGKLLQDLQIVAPDLDRHGEHEEMRLSQSPYHSISFQPQPAAEAAVPPRPIVVDDLRVHKGQSVIAGERLCSLSDLTQLYIEGYAFEEDVASISLAAQRDWTVAAVFQDARGKHASRDLKVAYVGNSIDSVSRKLSLFVELPNEIVSSTTNAEGQRYINWKYRIGQRLELEIPVDEWIDQIILPVDAVVKEGADWFVFIKKGSHFHRTPVHVQYRNQVSVVIANDGSLRLGTTVAMTSAHQLLMAIKNKSGGAVDPHAGHSH